MTNEERIKADAEAKYPLKASHTHTDGPRAGYIAGATAENAHIQPVIDAAEKVAKIFAHKDGNCAICELARALEQWKGKEVKVTDEEKYQQWIKENVTVLGEFDFLFANKRIYGKKELRRIYDYLTNPKQSK